MDEKSLPALVALPGRENLGLGRHWHALSVMFWVLNGFVYVRHRLVAAHHPHLVGRLP